MTTPPLIRISDETKAAARARWVEMWGDGAIDRAGEQMIDDILEAAAPLIAAQVLRDHGPCGHTYSGLLAEIEGRMPLICSRPTGHDGAHGDAWGAQWSPIEPEYGRERSPAEPARCGELNPHKDGYVCQRPPGHIPTDDHLFGPGRSLTEDAP